MLYGTLLFVIHVSRVDLRNPSPRAIGGALIGHTRGFPRGPTHLGADAI